MNIEDIVIFVINYVMIDIITIIVIQDLILLIFRKHHEKVFQLQIFHHNKCTIQKYPMITFLNNFTNKEKKENNNFIKYLQVSIQSSKFLLSLTSLIIWTILKLLIFNK